MGAWFHHSIIKLKGSIDDRGRITPTTAMQCAIGSSGKFCRRWMYQCLRVRIWYVGVRQSGAIAMPSCARPTHIGKKRSRLVLYKLRISSCQTRRPASP
jgi:hypothetical protein